MLGRAIVRKLSGARDPHWRVRWRTASQGESSLSGPGGAAVARPLAVRAQQLAGRTARIGIIQASLDDPVPGRGHPAFLDELKKVWFQRGPKSDNRNCQVGPGSPKTFRRKFANVDLLVATGPNTATEGRHGGEPNDPDHHVGGQLRQSDRTRLCEEPGAARRQRHRRSLSADGISRKASGALDPGPSRKNPTGS